MVLSASIQSALFASPIGISPETCQIMWSWDPKHFSISKLKETLAVWFTIDVRDVISGPHMLNNDHHVPPTGVPALCSPACLEQEGLPWSYLCGTAEADWAAVGRRLAVSPGADETTTGDSKKKKQKKKKGKPKGKADAARGNPSPQATGGPVDPIRGPYLRAREPSPSNPTARGALPPGNITLYGDGLLNLEGDRLHDTFRRALLWSRERMTMARTDIDPEEEDEHVLRVFGTSQATVRTFRARVTRGLPSPVVPAVTAPAAEPPTGGDLSDSWMDDTGVPGPATPKKKQKGKGKRKQVKKVLEHDGSAHAHDDAEASVLRPTPWSTVPPPATSKPQTCFCDACENPPARFKRIDDTDQEDSE
ncbi:hypothetical protein Q8F55_008555 [Vanrija albida]|uniref:Uncharacterized protein n=1 Tax=Vanrija albida TaxID=181172 RepID=A0ABR3PS68_9TREE